MEILGIILVRGGSKSMPGKPEKNIKKDIEAKLYA